MLCSQLNTRFQLALFWSTILRSMIQAEVVHHSLAKLLRQATVDLPSTVGSELRLAGPVRDWESNIRRICPWVAAPASHSFSPTRYRVDAFTQSFVRLPAPDALRPQSAWHSTQTIVYVLRSEADPTRYYTDLTSNLAGRMDAHNAGRVPHTADASLRSST